jgi:hypothetical protein
MSEFGVLSVSWYRFRATIGRQWTGYLVLSLLIALLGGLAIGSIAAARRTESSYPTFLAQTNPSDMDIDLGPYNPALLEKIRHLPQVKAIESYVAPNLAPVSPTGRIAPSGFQSGLQVESSINGLYFNQDKITILRGRMADPSRADEVVVDQFAAQLYGYHVGQILRYGIFTNAQIGASQFPTTPAHRIIHLRIVGIGVYNDEVVQDEVDKIPKLLTTPALAHQILSCCATYAWSGVVLRGGASEVPLVEREYLRFLPANAPYYFHVTSVIDTEAEQAVKPESVALGAFGIIAALTALIIAGLAISRQLQLDVADREVMRSIGADPAMTTSDGLIGIALAVVVGSLLAGVVAVGLSPIAFGPVRIVEPSSGLSFDWTAIGFGVLGLVLILAALTAAFALRGAPHRTGGRQGRVRPRRKRTRLPAPLSVGTRFALDSGRGRSTVPVRSAMVGVALAVTVVSTALIFGDSLTTLVSHPPLYGWNWGYMLESNAGYGDIPQAQATHLFGNDPDVADWTGIYFDSLLFDGKAVPVIGGSPRATVAPRLLAGHEVDNAHEVVLGPATLAQLHKQLGDTVRVASPAKTETLKIVGVASMPTLGIGFGLHLSIGSGAVVNYNLIPISALNIQGLPLSGPNAILVRLNPRVSPAIARRSLARITDSLNTLEHGSVGIMVFNDLLPAEIINYKSMGSIPTFLAVGLAAGAVFALGLTLVTSVRRRRRDLALLKALGFTRRQLALTVGWQSTVTAAIGTAIGLPIGIALGRSLWDLFAHEIYVVPASTLPVVALVFVALGAMALANLAAVAPGRVASHTPVAVLLRTE